MWYLTICCEAGVRKTRASLHLRVYRRLGMKLEWEILPSPAVLWVNCMSFLEPCICLPISEWFYHIRIISEPCILGGWYNNKQHPTEETNWVVSSMAYTLTVTFTFSHLQMTCHDFAVLFSYITDILSINFEIITGDDGVWLGLWQWSFQCSELLTCYPL